MPGYAQIDAAIRYTAQVALIDSMKPRTSDCALLDEKPTDAARSTAGSFLGAAVGCAFLARTCSALCVMLGVCLGPSAYAQAPNASETRVESPAELEARNTTMARALFDEGLKYVDSEQWEQAQDRFGRVLTLRYSAVAAYNYGLALARLGRSVVAASTLRRLLTDVNLDPHVHEHASSLLREVEARFAWLNVRVNGECKGCEVSLNEQIWPWAAIGVFVPVDPGSYALRLRLGNDLLAEQNLSLAATERLEATLDSGHPADPALVGASHATPGGPGLTSAQRNSAERPRESLLKSGWFWGAMGVLVIGITSTVVVASQ